MKKTILFLLVILTSIAAQAGDLTGIKIYLNPGHGGYDSDDRSIWTIPVPETWTNPNGFWESKSNLIKGLVLRDMLKAAGAEVIMSRVTNTTADDRNLSEIAQEANANNVDHFLSIHSNAHNTVTNYLLLLYHGYDNNPTVPASLPMSQNAWPIQLNNPLTVWSSTGINTRGDFTFYGNTSGLGVLRPLTVPGFLSEGSFHDYAPETHRLCNDDYYKLEALRMFKHFNVYFDKDMPVNGTIAGWVKSGNEVINIPNFSYLRGTADQWLPLNGTKVELLDETGQDVKETYITDNWFNGVFAFYDLTPGDYKLRFSLTNYDSKTVDITLNESDIAYSKVQLNNLRLTLPNFPDPEQESGVIPLTNYSFEASLNPVNPEWLSDNNIKRILYRNEKLYVLTNDPKILVINAKTAELIKELDLTGTENLSDIAFTADNFLLACNIETIAFESPTTYFNVYTWDDDNSAPYLLFKSQKNGNWTNGIVGETFAVSGSRWNCKVYTTAISTTPATYRIVGLHYNEDATDVISKYMMDANYSTALWGNNPIFTLTPNGDGDNICVDSEVMLPVEYKFDWTKPDRDPMAKIAEFAEISGFTLPATASGGNFFRNAKHNYLAMPVCEENGSKVGVVLFDVNDGLNKAMKVSEKYPNAGLGETPSDYMMAVGYASGYDVELTVLAKNQGIARYKTLDSPVANIYASELSITPEKDFMFTLNEDAQSVFITIFKDNEMLTSFNAGAKAKGQHTINNPFGTTKYDAYSITVTARPVSRPIKLSNDAPKYQFYAPRGVTVDNTQGSPYFGRIYVAETSGGLVTAGSPPNARTTQRGIYVMNAAHEDITGQGDNAYSGGITWGTNNATGYQYSPMRPAVAPDGKLYISDSSYGNSGVYIMDPDDPSADFKSVFGGTRNTTNGQVTENEIVIHNPVQNCYIMGTGDNTQLFILDRTASPVTGKIQRYDIGELKTPWISAPSATVFRDANNRMQNSYGTIAYDSHGGWWLAQYRAGAGGTAVPTLIHATNDVEDYNAGSDYPSGYQGVTAVSVDGSVLVLGTEAGKALVFDATYDENNKPTLTPKYTITWGGTSAYLQDAAFDAAGNLYLISNGNERLVIFSLPKADNSFTTRVSLDNITSIPVVKPIELNIYPNPVVSDFIIEGNNLKDYTIYDLSGKMVSAGKFNSDNQRISTSGLNTGVYVLQVRTAEGVVVKRIIKR